MNDAANVYYSVIEKERDALSAVLAQVDRQSVKNAIEILFRCRDKVVFIGVGKSGIIARKIAATFTSLGSRATHMHASDALHGDIGIVSCNDVVVLLSNSGTTEEVLLLLPHLSLRGVPHIAVVGNLASPLAREANVVLHAGVPTEADAHNLAPTCSTTAQIAIGDALAVALSNLKGITSEDFAFNHPAGRLGKHLTLRVGMLMQKGEENPTLGPASAFADVVECLAKFQAGAVSIVDTKGVLVGIITDGDLRRSLGKFPADKWKTLTASEMMTPDPVSTSPDTLAINAMRIMENRKSQISVLPVVDDSRQCVGIIRIHDLVKAGL